ncbi:MAG: LytTR family DNA-binding domain-containing protein [Bacteroidia bacterium]|nr:LytTR family DNA-binding domain-containing protein [Bacteroidia bacterium]
MLNCLVVDDEPIARNLLDKYISKAPGIHLAGAIDNGLEVIPFLAKENIDLMFLDINMPQFTGIELLKALRNPPHVIITTAYAEYGAESYDYEVIDYLLKPFSFERFLLAIQKVFDLTQRHTIKYPEVIHLKANNIIYKVPIPSIRFIAAFGNYIKVHTTDRMLVVRKPLAQMEKELNRHIVRVHKSYLVMPEYIERLYAKKIVLKDKTELPLGATFKKMLEDRLK